MPAIDLTTIAPAQRQKLIRVGRQYGSSDVLEQTQRAKNALATHAAALAAHGIDAADVQSITDIADTYPGLGVNREDAKTGRKTTNAALANAVHNAKSVRLSNNAALNGARRRLANRGDEATVRSIDAVLAQTARSGADAEKLATQLDQLRGLLGVAAIATVVTDAAARVTSLTTAADTVRTSASAKPRPPGTPEQTEQLDLLDGYAIELLRALRAAARAEARISGQDAIAKAFELSVLYRGTSRRTPTDPSPPPA